MSEKIAITIASEDWDSEEGEGVLSNWFYETGATVKQGDLLAEVMVEKTEIEVNAPASGTLTILVKAEETVTPGMAIAEIAV